MRATRVRRGHGRGWVRCGRGAGGGQAEQGEQRRGGHPYDPAQAHHGDGELAVRGERVRVGAPDAQQQGGLGQGERGRERGGVGEGGARSPRLPSVRREYDIAGVRLGPVAACVRGQRKREAGAV